MKSGYNINELINNHRYLLRKYDDPIYHPRYIWDKDEESIISHSMKDGTSLMEWYPNGKTKRIGEFENGMLIASDDEPGLVEYNEDGTLKSRKWFKLDERIEYNEGLLMHVYCVPTLSREELGN